MSSIQISTHFDAGSIEILDCSDPTNVQLALKKDNAAEFLQWFHFRLEGTVGQTGTIHITNAGESSYKGGWPDYNVCTLSLIHI